MTIPRIYTAGQLAYLDTFAGMVPCKVLRVIEPASGNTVTKGKIEIRLTATRGAYKRGEVLIDQACNVVPRPQRFCRCGKYKVNTNYYWSEGASAPLREQV